MSLRIDICQARVKSRSGDRAEGPGGNGRAIPLQSVLGWLLVLSVRARMGRWTSLIDDMVAGRWINPETGQPGRVPYEAVVIEERLDGTETELVGRLGFRGRLAVVSDQNTHDVMGARVAAALQTIATVESVVLDRPH